MAEEGADIPRSQPRISMLVALQSLSRPMRISFPRGWRSPGHPPPGDAPLDEGPRTHFALPHPLIPPKRRPPPIERVARVPWSGAEGSPAPLPGKVSAPVEEASWRGRTGTPGSRTLRAIPRNGTGTPGPWSRRPPGWWWQKKFPGTVRRASPRKWTKSRTLSSSRTAASRPAGTRSVEPRQG